MMRTRHIIMYMIVLAVLAISNSCDHRVLTDPSEVHYIRVYLDEQIKNVTCGFYNESFEHPEYIKPLNIRATLSSPATGEVVREGLIRNQGSDERGNYIDGYIAAPKGEYNLIMYQLGSPVTHIKNPNNCFDMLAYTDPVNERVHNYISDISSEMDLNKIMLEPEHMMVARYEGLVIENSFQADTLRTAEGDYFTASSIAKSYYLQLRITGVEWVTRAAAVLTGMSGSSRLCENEGMVLNDPVNLFFTMLYGERGKRSGTKGSPAILYTTFTTFGKITDISSEMTLNFEFTKSDGSTQTESFDMTEVFKTPMAIENQWLILDKEINITPPPNTETSGSMDPGVEGWKDKEADLYM